MAQAISSLPGGCNLCSNRHSLKAVDGWLPTQYAFAVGMTQQRVNPLETLQPLRKANAERDAAASASIRERMSASDWKCPKCGYNNYGRNVECRGCPTASQQQERRQKEHEVAEFHTMREETAQARVLPNAAPSHKHHVAAEKRKLPVG